MELPQDSQKPPVTLVFWIIWFGILNGLVMLQFFVGGGIPSGTDQGDPPMWVLLAAGGLALVALTIRFLIIPRVREIPKKLTAMVVGLALSEVIGMLGIFVVEKKFPSTKLGCLVLAIACIVSLAPTYAKPRKENGRF